MKRATFINRYDIKYFFISIHALVKRATADVEKTIIDEVDFNPRPREEGDCFDRLCELIRKGISIHALVKRATLCKS